MVSPGMKDKHLIIHHCQAAHEAWVACVQHSEGTGDENILSWQVLGKHDTDNWNDGTRLNVQSLDTLVNFHPLPAWWHPRVWIYSSSDL